VNETKDLIRWITRLKYNDLPPNVVDFTKRFLIDDIGCMFGGSLQLGNKAVLRDVISLGAKPESTIAVYGNKSTAPNVALLDGAFIAGWDYDSTAVGGGHMGSQTAAMLPMSEREIANGREMLAAECVGIEIQSRIGNTGISFTRSEHPWHSNTTFGPFAAAVVTGKILGFDEEMMENAIAIASSTLGGNYQHYWNWGSSMKRVRCGLGASAGVQAALLAKEGLTGPREILEGERGLLEVLFGRAEEGTPYYDKSSLNSDLGKVWYTLTYMTKSGACLCVSSGGSALETALALKGKHDITAEDIESVTVEVNELHTYTELAQNQATNLGTTPMQRLGTSGWSLRWMLAETLLLGRPTAKVQLANIRPYGRYREIEELSQKIEIKVNEAYYKEHFKARAYPSQSGRVIIKLKDGRVLDGEPLPYLGQRMSDGTVNLHTPAQLEEKVREQAVVAGISKGKQDRVIEFVRTLEDQRDILGLIPNMLR
jgi:2-methylcitrate dehydratase PrpD